MRIEHIANSLGKDQRVNNLTKTLEKDGYTIASQPHTTGDEYYESLIIDPEGNRIELTT